MRIGKGSQQFAVHSSGQELPMHDPKIDPMLGVIYSADPTPGRHTMLTGEQHLRLFDYLNAATGWNLSPDEYIQDKRTGPGEAGPERGTYCRSYFRSG